MIGIGLGFAAIEAAPGGHAALNHGDGIASWAVNERALRRRHGIRTGLEDTPVLPDGQLAPDNAALMRAAAALMAEHGYALDGV